MPASISNPVLRGFNPDPSIVRVGDDYYIATSTFEWLPGIQLHHSKDLIHWQLIGHALTRESQINLRGIADSGGVWAPSLSYADGQFWLIYTNIRTCGMGRPFKDIGIYLTTAKDINGPWSDPVTLNAIGFDPSLFHDDDGRKWLVNMMWDFRKGRNRFAGIVLQEYDHARRALVGPMTKIFEKDVLIEGPNIYKHDGWYYLMLAEGGTGWNHGISMARSQNIVGPYEFDPQDAVLTTRDDPTWPLQKAGHGELVQTANGEWYAVHLASRPVGSGDQRRCILGRETCLQKVVWSSDGWLRLIQGSHHPAIEVPPPTNVSRHPWPKVSDRDDFAKTSLDHQWAWLRSPLNESWLSLQDRPGWLRLSGRDSLFSLFTQSLVAKRVTSLRSIADTCVEFTPTHFTQMAGLVFYYDTRTHYYLRITHDEIQGKVLGIVLTDDGSYDELLGTQIPINHWHRAWLRAELNHTQLQFFASPDGQSWSPVGAALDATKISDDYGSVLHFTGAFFGLCAQDLGGTNTPAYFDYFQLRAIERS
ncbi:MAG: glycoside hydrolase family 43 protein [Nibricoccus sp.]